MEPRYQPKAWQVALAAPLVALGALTAYLALNPRVADDYRAYYIERTASCFPRLTSHYYPLGTPVTFVPGRNGFKRDTLRWCGFMPMKADGIKTFGDTGVLKFKVGPAAGGLLLTFAGAANATTDQPPHSVPVVVNGVRLTTLAINDHQRVLGKILVPAPLVRAGGGTLTLAFEMPRVAPPGTSGEPVTLQMRLTALRLVALERDAF